MSNSYQILEEKFQQLAQIGHAITFLQWDQLVMMPPKGNQSRAASIAELVTMHHELLSTPIIGETKPLEALRIIHSFDPCIACAVHVLRPTGETVTVIKAGN